MQDSYQKWSGIHAQKSCRPTSAYEPKGFMQPLSTTSRDAYQAWAVIKRPTLKPKERDREESEYPTGRTTMQDSFQPFRGNLASKSCAPREKVLENTPFDATTTSRAAYLKWPIAAKYQRKKPEQQTGFGTDTGPFPSSTYRDQYREIKMPVGQVSALGLQVVGGKFFTMMTRGTTPPANKKCMMTTTLDGQTSMDIVVILSESEQNRKGKILGEFTLDGISPGPKGTPQVEVTFNYDTSNTLRVTANDLQGNRARALTVTEKVRLTR